MGTDVAVRERPGTALVLSNEQLTYISRTDFVPPGLRGNLPAILACVATGRALGIDDMSALRQIHIIDGKPSFSAELMVKMVRERGHSITGEVGEDKAVVKGKRADSGDEMTATFTLAMAERAGLLGKKNWKQYPESMLWARAVSQLCRMLFADCFAGGTYTAEELGDEVVGEAWLDDETVAEEGSAAPRGDTGTPAGEPSTTAGDVAPSSATARRELKAWLEENGVESKQTREVSAELFPGVASKDLDADQVARLREVLAERLVAVEA